jgi:hypothetical protein
LRIRPRLATITRKNNTVWHKYYRSGREIKIKIDNHYNEEFWFVFLAAKEEVHSLYTRGSQSDIYKLLGISKNLLRRSTKSKTFS